MSRQYELVKQVVEENNYRVLEEDGEFIIIRYQLNAMNICPSVEDDNFVTILLTKFADVTEDNFAEVVMRCHILNKQLKQVKLYTIDNALVAASEFFFLDKDDLAFQIKQSLTNLIKAKVEYKKYE